MTTHPTTGPGPDFSSERGEKASPERADVLGGAATSLGHGSFDDHHPPAQELLDDCVHCGFCLPTCPTYALWGEEMDSPRGRIYLMEMAAKGEIPLEGAFTTHIDRCLGCMACVTACPSGVQYDRLLEATRPQIERHVTRTRADRWFREAIFTLFPYKRRLRAASIGGALYQKLRPKSMDKLHGAGPAALRAPRGHGVAAAAGARARRVRPHRAPHARGRAAPGPGRPAHRLRAGRLLPPRQRGHRAGARRRGLGRHRPARAGVLRGAGPARGPRGGGRASARRS